MKFKYRSIIILLLSITFIYACAAPPPLSDEMDIYRMKEKVELTIVKEMKSNAGLPDGDTLENNMYTRYLTEKSNVSFKVRWASSGQDYEEKLKLAVATHDIPDVLVVDETLFRTMVEQEQIMDLTNIFNEYASPLLKELYASSQNKALKKATIDGKLMAIPNLSVQGDAFSMLWVREDWLNELKLTAPRTVEEVGQVARAFIANNMGGDNGKKTLGLIGNVARNAANNTVADFTGLFAAYQAFPGIWLREGNGQVIYGSTTLQAKEALSKLRQWYEEGIIDPDFYLRQEISEPIISGEAGMFFAPWFAPWYPLNESMMYDKRAVWRPYPIFSNDNKLYSKSMPVSQWYIVVRKGVDKPEALMVYLNHYINIQRFMDPDAKQLNLSLDASYYPIYTSFDYPDAVTRKHAHLMQALEGVMEPEQLDPEMRQHYNTWNRVVESPESFSIGDWMAPYAYIYGAAVLKNDIVYVDNIYTAMSKTMRMKWDKLQRLEQSAYLSIITGEQPLDYFEQFVELWRAEGGEQIIKEIAEANSYE
ncbi:extracellular solute-binding protein [Paenibacillus sp. GXUN7292]|uniref:extracellular solute-binding protein n=1 Tax=Paenibacillus sp. GXUN7292 TaxID=3422499 RepID=UPI003D7D37B1